MKEFIEKVLGRLEEKIEEKYIESADKGNVFSDYPCKVQAFKEAIEIVNQLAEEYKPTTNSNIQEVIDNLEVYTVGRLKNARVHITVEELQNQIDRLEQLAEEYNNDFCEWHNGINSVFPIKTSCGNSIDVNYGYEFCPYCGKKIKVAPYQPKGE